jgi:hypothetical protein
MHTNFKFVMVLVVGLQVYAVGLHYMYVGVTKVPRLDPQTANGLHYVNACAMLESKERRHSVCQMASLCEHWELHNMSVCHHVSANLERRLLK